ncbi:hypothetical protein H6G97_31845 [Nostoc flagelliforme FACHB-838]|uniref:Uncharacterized protein n=1 Tax=Nostoc flagelliforme FACHB-838 TaxID=2692904 RepID=A0ABR8E030_9NOSO|nr:hypothetical protein [Nostoc flagelliforme]MBD2533895.1 hypothetical protein [Nostoc flagelliforme FACHB-838]
MKASPKTKVALTAGIMLGGMTMLLPNVALSQSATPGNITGRWSGVGDDTSITLRITQTANNVISGTMIDNGTTSPVRIEGFYIPSTRRIVFVRIPANSSIPFQFYDGWISQRGLRIGGHLSVWTIGNGASANGVDFPFNFTKVSDFPN